MALTELGQIKQVLDTAKTILSGDRRESYGSPQESFARIATLWSAYLGYAISSHDVAMLMILLKIARQKNKHKDDNLVDMCGYAALATVLNEGTKNEERSGIPGYNDSSELLSTESVRHMVKPGPCPSNCSSLFNDTERAICEKFNPRDCPKPD